MGVILLGLAIWFGRRQVKTNRRRRMARHFEIDNTEDGGEGGSSSGSGRSGISRAFAGLMGNRGWGRQSDNGGLPKPFGGVKVPDEDAPNPRRIQNTMSVLYGNLRGGQPADLADQIFPMAGGGGEQAMAQAGGRGASQPITARAPAAGRWEEVDFGLGRVDQANRASRPPALLNGLGISSGNQPLGSTPPPLLVVQPPTQPHTPNGEEFNRLSAYPTMIPEPSPTIRQLRTVANVTGRDQEGTPRTEWSTTSSPLAAQQQPTPGPHGGQPFAYDNDDGYSEAVFQPLPPRLSFDQKLGSGEFLDASTSAMGGDQRPEHASSYVPATTPLGRSMTHGKQASVRTTTSPVDPIPRPRAPTPLARRDGSLQDASEDPFSDRRAFQPLSRSATTAAAPRRVMTATNMVRDSTSTSRSQAKRMSLPYPASSNTATDSLDPARSGTIKAAPMTRHLRIANRTSPELPEIVES